VCWGDPADMSGKCAECVRRKRPCVSTSLDTLDAISDRIVDDIKQTEAERERLLEAVALLQAKLLRLRALQKDNNRKTASQLACIAREMEESGELVPSSSLDWNALLDPVATGEWLRTSCISIRSFVPVMGSFEGMSLYSLCIHGSVLSACGTLWCIPQDHVCGSSGSWEGC
jgi:hypothetical protein